MKRQPETDDLQNSGLMLGSEPIENVRYKASADDDKSDKDGGDQGDDDGTDRTDSDGTDGGDSKDADGKD